MTGFPVPIEILNFQDHRHDQSTDVLHFDDIKVVFQFQQVAVLGIQLFEGLLAFLPIFLKDIQRVIVIVKINQFGVAIHQSLEVLIAQLADGSRFLVALLFATLVVDDGIQRVELIFCELSNGQIDMIRRIKPTAPKPVQIDPGGIFKGSEKVRRLRAFELPSLGIGTKGKVKKFTTKNGLPEDVQGGSRFSVGVVAKL